LIDQDPFSAGAFTNLWWGSKLIDDSKRNGVTWDVGALASLTALAHATITGRAYFEFWSDRHCPVLDSSMPNGFEGTDPIKVCTDLKQNMLSDADRARVRKLLGADATGFDRDNGVRFLLSIIGEIAIEQEFSVFLILEGAPFQQAERALFTNLFSGSMADRDYRIYGHAGVTLKF
jgi:hypothetical protein